MSDRDKADVGNKIDVAHVARLAMLHLNEDEISTLQSQLDQIVGYVKKIDQLDLSGIEPTSHAWPVQNIFRKDDVTPGIDHESIIANAPSRISGQFCVPRIIE